LGAPDPIEEATADVMRGHGALLRNSYLFQGFESEGLLSVLKPRGLVTRGEVLEEVERPKEKAARGK